MSQETVVVFDLGKVLLDFDYSIAAQALAGRSDVSAAEISEFINQSPLLIRYEKGEISGQEFFGAVHQMSGYQGTLEDFSALFSAVFTPITPMIRLKKDLTEMGIPTYVFSNTNDLAISYIRTAYPFYNTFDGYVLSYEHGCMKPDEQLYRVVEEVTGKAGPRICYVDDRLENVLAARARGWRALQHVDPHTSERWIRGQFGRR